ncbi:60S ribosomal protein L10-like [Mastomys coucha]|uniref:60S ribosomal protein L10-like n=1 Tax=Mastomys coucha TaxID=35658 RepID=UPI0012616005|nr:60S ribosomal protein L10-like [Mastomys coucha]
MNIEGFLRRTFVIALDFVKIILSASRNIAERRVRLQTGMWGAFGKPQGTVARVHIGQVIMSICTKLQNKEHVIEALRRAKFKFPGHQKIHISKKWGFTKFNADEFEDMVAEKWLIPDGCGVKYIPNRGPLDKWRALHS